MFKPLTLACLLLLILPLSVQLSPWQWTQTSDNFLSYFLFLITETSSKPYAILTCMALAAFYFFSFKNNRNSLKIVAVLAFFIVATQGVKSLAKPYFKADRPFISAMLETPMERQIFYALTEEKRAEQVLTYYKNSPTPHYLAQHRSQETSFSFPSGHSIFVAAWLMLAVGVSRLFPQKSFKMILPFVLLWAWLVLASRLYLGMHYPADEIASIVIAWLMSLPYFALLNKMKTRFFNH